MAADLSGVVLVGGRSRRMGRDKARITVDGVPLWRRQVAVLEAAGACPVWLALRARQHSLGERRREIRDGVPGAGPIGGLHSAMLASTSRWLAVLAVDMPQVDAAWFRRLRRRCRRGKGAVVAQPDGYEPLAAIYPSAALGVLERRLKRRQYSLQGLLAELVAGGTMAAVRLPDSEGWRAANWNAPADMSPVSGRREIRRPRAGRV
jgi:molybdopterin-guanine dinucleotide biosynthesis protein A